MFLSKTVSVPRKVEMFVPILLQTCFRASLGFSNFGKMKLRNQIRFPWNGKKRKETVLLVSMISEIEVFSFSFHRQEMNSNQKLDDHEFNAR